MLFEQPCSNININININVSKPASTENNRAPCAKVPA